MNKHKIRIFMDIDKTIRIKQRPHYLESIDLMMEACIYKLNKIIKI